MMSDPHRNANRLFRPDRIQHDPFPAGQHTKHDRFIDRIPQCTHRGGGFFRQTGVIQPLVSESQQFSAKMIPVRVVPHNIPHFRQSDQHPVEAGGRQIQRPHLPHEQSAGIFCQQFQYFQAPFQCGNQIRCAFCCLFFCHKTS